MSYKGKNLRRAGPWLTVAAFAVAMAWVEAAVVYYLRTLIGRIEPYQPNPLPIVGGLGPVEMVREGATMIMLLTVGMLAGQTWRERFGYTAIAFGVWDIFYYVFLKAMCSWPHSLLDWDILFLLPLPWWGPVLAPVLIACLMIVWGILASQFEPGRSRVESEQNELNSGPYEQQMEKFCNSCHILQPHTSERTKIACMARRRLWVLNALGMSLALYVFMADSIRVSGAGVDALRSMLPSRFNWGLFGIALALMATPVVHEAAYFWRLRPFPTSIPTRRVQNGKLASLL